MLVRVQRQPLVWVGVVLQGRRLGLGHVLSIEMSGVVLRMIVHTGVGVVAVQSPLAAARLTVHGLQMHRGLLAGVAAVALVSVPAVCPGLAALPRLSVDVRHRAGPADHRVPGVARVSALLDHDDLVLVLDTAAPVALLAASRVVLGAEALELDLYLVLGVAPVAGAAAAPGHGPRGQPALLPRSAARPAARPTGRPLPLSAAGGQVPSVSIGLMPPASQPVHLILCRFPAGTVVSVPSLFNSLSITPISSSVTFVAISVTFITLPVRFISIRFVTAV